MKHPQKSLKRESEAPKLTFKGLKLTKKVESKQIKKNDKNNQLVKFQKEDKVAILKQSPEHMSIVDIINDRKSGVLAPSEVKRRQKLQDVKKEKRKSVKDDDSKVVDEVISDKKSICEHKSEYTDMDDKLPLRDKIVFVDGKPRLVKASAQSTGVQLGSENGTR